MLTIVVGSTQHYDEETNEFIQLGGVEIQLEYSLASLSKWESKFEKPFLGPQEKTRDEVLGFIYEMITTPEISPDVVQELSEDNFAAINAYMESKQTATWFADTPNAPKTQSEIITAELIYYWMVSYKIPWEAQHWHLNRLFTLIKVFNAKSEKPKPMSKGEAAARRRQLNEQRRQQYNTSG